MPQILRGNQCNRKRRDSPLTANNIKLDSYDFSAVVHALEESVKRNAAESLLLSGGLDTSLIAYLATAELRPYCVTVAMEGAPAPDVPYAEMVAQKLGLEHKVHHFGKDELEQALREVVVTLKTFDPMEVRNSVAIYIALKVVGDRGIDAVMTGDGADELLAGYSFYFGLSKEDLDSALNKMWQTMSFSAVALAASLGMEARQPFLDEEFSSFARNMDSRLKVRDDRGRTWGKWVLRKAFAGIVPEELLWREKNPAEVGTGTTVLPHVYQSLTADRDFRNCAEDIMKKEGVRIRTAEHLHYYRIYRELVGLPPTVTADEKACPDCKGGIAKTASFCKICGAYPV